MRQASLAAAVSEVAHAPLQVRLAARICLTLTSVYLVIGVFALSPALPAIKAAADRDDHSVISISLVGSIAGFTFALASVLGGGLVRRLGYRTVLVWALSVATIAGLAGAAWANLSFILATRAIVGGAVALIVNASLFAVGWVIPAPLRQRMFGLIALVGSASGFLLYPLVGFLGAIHWRLAVLPDSLYALAIPMVLTLPRLSPSGSGGAAGVAGWLGLDLIGAAALTGVVNFIVSVFGSLYLSQLGVVSPFVLSLPALCGATGASIGSAVCVATGRYIGLNARIIIALLCYSAGLGLMGTHTDVHLILAGAIIAACGAGLFVPSMNAAALVRSPGNPGPTLGLASGTLFGSMVLFPLLAPPLARVLGGVAHVILGVAVISVFGAMLFLFLERRLAA